MHFTLIEILDPTAPSLSYKMSFQLLLLTTLLVSSVHLQYMEDGRTMFEDQNTMVEDQNTIFEDQNPMYEDQNAVYEDQNTMFEDQMYEDQNTIFRVGLEY